jgi:hypothetical protein
MFNIDSQVQNFSHRKGKLGPTKQGKISLWTLVEEQIHSIFFFRFIVEERNHSFKTPSSHLAYGTEGEYSER